MEMTGLTSAEAARRAHSAPSQIGHRHNSDLALLSRQFRSPIILLLLASAGLSMVFRETTDSLIIILIVLASSGLGFLQERGAVRTVDALMSSVAVHADVIRDGREQRVLIADVVPGDLVVLRAGDVVPGDCRVLRANGLLVNEAALTGENYPSSKSKEPSPEGTDPLHRSDTVYLGTHVSSGEGHALVEHTGVDTKFGEVTEHVSRQHLPTAFERGTTQFGYLLMRWTAVLVVGILAFNVVVGRPFVESLLFSLSLTVGLTPQMLPAIITLSLSRGTTAMARRKVVVKRLDAIEDIGGIDLLCTDKTGTITVGSVGLDSALDADGSPSERVHLLAWLNARHQTGYANPMDQAILASDPPDTRGFACTGEAPFDFIRRRLSVRIEGPGTCELVTKGALEPLLSVCSAVRTAGGGTEPVEGRVGTIVEEFARLSAEGLRVIGVATAPVPRDAPVTMDLERDMTFEGFLTFDDPPKEGVSQGVARLAGLGVEVCVISGDNRLAAAHTARQVGLDATRIVVGPDVTAATDEELTVLVRGAGIFAEIDPVQKERIVRAFVRNGRNVGFLGDGINDTPALHAADVGISVDNAVDVARQTADLVLLEKDLSVVAAGIEEGRTVFANTLKYVNVTTSAHFGNMVSFALTTTFLPFLPLLPMQILLLNFLSDLPGITIATDNVDPEQIMRPHRWDMVNLRKFMVAFGLASTLFDMITFVLLRYVFSDGAVPLRSNWFVLSTFTQLAALLVLRTQRPCWRSRPGPSLLWSSVAVAALTLALPYSPLRGTFQFVGPQVQVVASLLVLTVAYVAVNEMIKTRIPVFGP